MPNSSASRAPVKRECLFQEDNGGKGAQIGEIERNGRFLTFYGKLHLRPAVLDYLIRKGYTALYLTYRGHWNELSLLYR